MVLEVKRSHDEDSDPDFDIMNSAVSTESMDMAEEDMSQVEGCGLSGSDDDDECASSPAGSAYDDGQDMIKSAMSDEVTKQLAAAGPVGMAAAAAIASSKKRKRPHSFETNPSVRKRHQNRLLRKLRQTIEEFATRVGQQAVVLVATPGKPNTSYRVFGAKPLEDVVRNLRCMIMEELENALAQQAPPPPADDPSLFELPPLIIDGIPTPVEKMTQAQLRAFIPLMLKYSMVRGKPGWGRESTRPPWWPKDLPWANVRMDARSEDEKQKMSWTHALRQIVINCYKYHGREDLLPAFTEDDEKGPPTQPVSACMPAASSSSSGSSRTPAPVLSSQQVCIDQMTLADVDMSQYAPAVLQTITNPDGTVSLIQVDPNNPIITLPDGTTAQVIHSGEGGGGVVQALDGEGAVAVDLNAVTEATLNHDGQLILTGEDGHGYPVSVSGVITVPVSASVYQSMVASMQHQDGVCVAPIVQVSIQDLYRGAGWRNSGGAVDGWGSGPGDAAGSRRCPGAAGAQPQGCHRAHQGHATGEGGKRRGGSRLLATDAGGRCRRRSRRYVATITITTKPSPMYIQIPQQFQHRGWRETVVLNSVIWLGLPIILLKILRYSILIFY